MSIIGAPSEWVGLIDPMVPVILHLVIESWEEMPAIAADEREDDITIALCRAMKRNRTARQLMFTIDTQQVEPDPAPGEELGRLDISLRPLVPREDIYFCLEGKRLNVIKDGKTRPYASEYVTLGMQRFVTGQYAKEVLHGGMVGYVLNGDIATAISNVGNSVQRHHVELSMTPPGELAKSSLLEHEQRARETFHDRKFAATGLFRIHHLFLARRT
jgi:hypothetical protein